MAPLSQAIEHIDHHIKPQTRALEDQNTSGIGNWRSVFLGSTCCPTIPPFSLKTPYTLNLKVFHLYTFLSFSLLHIRVIGLIGFSLSQSLSLSLSEEWKWNEMRVSLFLSLRLYQILFELWLPDCLTLLYNFINICPCFLALSVSVGVGEI